MKTKELKWPKWTEQYENIEENNKTIRKVTRTDRTWGWINGAGTSAVSATRIVRRALRKVENI